VGDVEVWDGLLRLDEATPDGLAEFGGLNDCIFARNGDG